jgi:hypothetical protein
VRPSAVCLKRQRITMKKNFIEPQRILQIMSSYTGLGWRSCMR